MIKFSRPFFFLMSLLLLTQSQAGFAVEQDEAIKSSVAAVQEKNYDSAIKVLEEAIEKQPENSEYYHLLGRVYGLKAKDSSWFEAVSLAKKTRINFEKSVELDPKNISALHDLREYYLKAPEFLGGGKDKADRISRQLVSMSDWNSEEEEEAE